MTCLEDAQLGMGPAHSSRKTDTKSKESAKLQLYDIQATELTLTLETL